MNPIDGLRILIVDDEVADVTAKMVTKLGGVPLPTRSIAEARMVLARRTFDAALVDLLLLNGNGADLIRELQLVQNLPCVLFSGVDAETMGFEGIDCIFLAKPFTLETLRSALLEAIGESDTVAPPEGSR